MISKILVPLDRSKLAEYALPFAIHIAEKHNSDICLFHVPASVRIDVPELAYYNLHSPEMMLSRYHVIGKEYLNSVRYGIGRQHDQIQWHALMVDGDPAGGIVDTAESEDVDLIVMSTHGYSGLSRWMFGSVTEKVLRAAPCPVLVVRDTAPLNNMLIALDGSKLAETSIRTGMLVAAALEDSQVRLVRVVQDEAEIAEAEKYLHHVAEAFPDANVETAVLFGAPAHEILEYARKESIDIVTMATHGRSGLRRWAYGSVTEKVLRGGAPAMLIIRPPIQVLN